jgi:hypothetical protein
MRYDVCTPEDDIYDTIYNIYGYTYVYMCIFVHVYIRRPYYMYVCKHYIHVVYV